MTKHGDTLPTKIAQNMLQRIVSEEFPPGTLLPSERELQDDYQVSRAVIREAIKLLASRKVVATSRGQGAIVASDFTEPVVDALLLAFHRSQIQADEMFSVRKLLEPQAAALAAEHATIQQIRKLTAIADSFEQISFEIGDPNIQDSVTRWGKLDHAFHELIAEASQNTVLSILISVMVGIVWDSVSSKMPKPAPDRFVVSVDQHKAIAAAISRRDPETARRTMIEHIETSLRNVVNAQDRIEVRIEDLI